MGIESVIEGIKQLLGNAVLQKIDVVIASAKQAESEKNWALSAELYGEAQRIDASDSNWPYRQGLSFERAKRFPESIKAYEKAIALNPRHDWWFRLGISAEGAKDFKLAKMAYHSSLLLDKSADPIAFKLLAISPTAINSRFKLLSYLRGKLPEIKKRVENNKSVQMGEPKVFTYWDTGFEQAPTVVKTCMREMVAKHNPGQVVAIDANNWRYYVELPQHILDKIPTNKAHFSDVIRVALLAQYGGIWADATCMPARSIGEVFNEMSKSGYFSYYYSTARISNWFLCSSGDNYIAKMMFESICEYWKDYDYALHYYVFHHIFEVLYYLDDRFKKIWDESTKAKSKEPHAIQVDMLKPYVKSQFDKAYACSDVHKLTYKFNLEELKPNSTLAHIVRGDF